MRKKNNPEKKCEPHEIYTVASHGIKVYPTTSNGRFYIEVDNNGKIKRYDKHLTQNEVNNALANTISYFYNKIMEAKNGKP